MRKNILLLTLGFFAIFTACDNKTEKMENELKAFIAHHDSLIVPLTKQLTLASWEANITGKDEDFTKVETYQKEFVKILSDSTAFAKLKTIKESVTVKDTVLARELEVLYNLYLSNQVDTALQNEIIAMETNIEKKYNNYRAEIKGKKYSDNEIENVLRNSANNSDLEAAWTAHKKIGPVVADDILKLVKKRNELAVKLGYRNFHEMSLMLSEEDPAEISNLFDELDSLTRGAFAEVKADVDSAIAQKVKLSIDQLRPWHYQNRYFQEAPQIYNVDLDKYYKDKNLETLTRDYYSGIGLPIDDMLAKSDLYEKPGKCQHAFCTDIDNEGDVRVLCNIKPDAYWMNTMLHEYGHAVYDKFISRELPYTLREPAHIFTTEAIAMLFGRLSSNPQWIQDMTGISNEEKLKIAEECYKTLRLEQLVFSRWAQVMYRFEKSLYENPAQDLNTLWWNLVEKYQMVKKPEGRNEPDWATKIHIATSPCYYHNYLLGELLASQLHYYICDNILKTTDYKLISYTKSQETGKFLLEEVFKPGALYKWNDMIERATGEKLTAKYYAKQFVK